METTRSTFPKEIWFSNRYIDWIINGKKKATTRLLRTGKHATLEQLNEAKIQIGDLCIALNSNTKESFGNIQIERIEDYMVQDLNDELAFIENLESAEKLKEALRYHYNDITE